MHGVEYTPATIGMLIFVACVSLLAVVYIFIVGFEAMCDYFFPMPDNEDKKDNGCCACADANKRAEEARKAKEAEADTRE